LRYRPSLSRECFSSRLERFSPVSVRILFLRACLCALLVLCTSGCAVRRSINGPAVPKALVTNKNLDYAHVCDANQQKTMNDVVVCDVKKFQECTTDTAPKCDRAERDRIIYTLKLIIDQNFDQYAKSFEQVADTATFLGEVSAASLTGVATIYGASDIALKNILTLASSLTQSTTISMQKNFYQKQTSYTILAQMESQRTKKWSEILTSMQDHNTGEYPLAYGLADLAQYRQAGTAVQALQSIQQNAGAVHQEAEKTINDMR
jgi:hypothetical protein